MAVRLDKARWAIIRRLYEGDELTVKQIAALAGIGRRTISAHALREGWVPRPPGGRPGLLLRTHGRTELIEPGEPLALLDPSPPEAGQPSEAARASEAAQAPDEARASEPARPVDRRALVDRLWAALDRHMADDEAGRTGPDPRRPQTLDVLVRTIERLSGMEATGSERAPEAEPPEPERLREELLRRIEALAAEE